MITNQLLKKKKEEIPCDIRVRQVLKSLPGEPSPDKFQNDQQVPKCSCVLHVSMCDFLINKSLRFDKILRATMNCGSLHYSSLTGNIIRKWHFD